MRVMQLDPDTFDARFCIKKARTPRVQGGLSSTMLVVLENREVGHLTVGFSHALVRFVGSVLPRGVSPHDPAYMTLALDPERDCYILYAQYLGDGQVRPKRYPLCEITHRPEWLRGVKKVAAQVAQVQHAQPE